MADLVFAQAERAQYRKIFDQLRNETPVADIRPSVLSNVIDTLERLDAQIIKLLKKDENISDEAVHKEFEETTTYRIGYLQLKDDVKQHQAAIKKSASTSKNDTDRTDSDEHDGDEYNAADTASRQDDDSTLSQAQHHLKSQMKYPKLEFMKFDGNIASWIHWWGKFSKIDGDPKLRLEDKFEYLLQATEGKVHNQVKRYPPSAGNYTAVMKLLKSRYGDEETLSSYYIRQLSDIIKNSSNFPDLASLYEELRSNISNLETLGLSKEKIFIIVPLIESSLPLDILTAWQEEQFRFPINTQAGSREGSQAGSRIDLTMDPPDNRLKQIMEFLSMKVEALEKAKLKRQSFDTPSVQPDNDSRLATAAALANVSNNNRGQGNTRRGNSRSGNSRQNNSRTGDSSGQHTHNQPCNQNCCSTDQGTPPASGRNRRQNPVCIFCGNKHYSAQCRKARDMSLEQKKLILADKNACFICLIIGHMAFECTASITCILCRKRHYVLLCPEVETRRQAEETQSQISQNSSPTQTPTCLAQGRPRALHTVYMKTILVNILRPNGEAMKVRVFIDPGSKYSYIRIKLAANLGLKILGQHELIHCLFGGVELPPVTIPAYKVTVQSLTDDTQYDFKFLGQSGNICPPIDNTVDESILQKLHTMGIQLSDQGNNEAPIDLLFGADLEGFILTNDIRPVTEGIKAVRTTLGWTLTGSDNNLPSQQPKCTALNCLNVTSFLSKVTSDVFNDTTPAPKVTSDVSNDTTPVLKTGDYFSPDKTSFYTPTSVFTMFNHSIEDFWDLEAFGLQKDIEPEEIQKQFSSKITVDEEGRYQVPLPWAGDLANLGTNFNQSLSRLTSLTTKLRKTGRFNIYHEALRQWYDDGIIEPVINDNGQGHYMPHRPVFRDSGTTKCRPVFDASARTETGFTINQLLFKGPNLVTRIPNCFNNFRYHEIGVTADIKKAFLQISITPADREYLKFLWWDFDDPTKLTVYRHRRVVMGCTSSPCQLGTVLEHHFLHHPLQQTAQILRKSFYVDNLLSSVQNLKKLENFIDETEKVLADGKFQLHQWQHSCHGSTTPITPVLGVNWDRSQDTLSAQPPKQQDISTPVTKRQLLSIVMSIFDPIGFTAPLLITPKHILQQTWELKLSWDDPLPEKLDSIFQRWYQTLPSLVDCHLPRFLFQPNWSEAETSLHAFSDGSGIAYGTCIFARSQVADIVHVNLITAKSRIAPTNPTITIPRIELLGAQLAANLYSMLCTDDRFQQFPLYCWTDSEVVLFWLRQPKIWKPFVGNRVTDILKKTNIESWRHVPGKLNPADLISRGCDAELLASDRWWEGPQWLRDSPDNWPKTQIKDVRDEALTEMKKTATACLNTSETPSLVSKIASQFEYTEGLRLAALMARFLKTLRTLAYNSKHTDTAMHQPLCTGELNGDEIHNTEQQMVKRIQEETQQAENNASKLDVIVDHQGILRVKTKLILGPDPYQYKYPALLPHNHPMVANYIQEVHRKLNHAGVTTVMVEIRKTFWLTKARRTIKSVVNKCLNCKKLSAKSGLAPVAPLPPDRIKVSAEPFQIVGLDAAGPLYPSDTHKYYIILFTCAVFRAVHLELVPHMTTESFLMALRRFMARRGRIKDAYCDNGTNFVGGKNALATLDWTAILKQTSVDKITWHFNPPAAPWWGGFWERLVGVVKSLLLRTLGATSLTLEALTTLITEVESTVNQRPLTYISENDNVIPITPAMFLFVQNYNSIDIDTLDRTSAVQHIRENQEVRDLLRKRFQDEYLSLLVSRSPKRKELLIKPGDIVLVGADNVKRQLWPMGRVTSVMVGRDGHTRTAEVHLSSGKLIRPINRLFPLELDSDQVQDVPTDNQPGKLDKNPTNTSSQVSQVATQNPTTESATNPVQTLRKTIVDPALKVTRTRVIRPPARFL